MLVQKNSEIHALFFHNTFCELFEDPLYNNHELCLLIIMLFVIFFSEFQACMLKRWYLSGEEGNIIIFLKLQLQITSNLFKAKNFKRKNLSGKMKLL